MDNFSCMYVCIVYHKCVKYPQRPEEFIIFSGTAVMSVCEPPHGWWELNPCPLEDQPGLLTTEPSK